MSERRIFHARQLGPIGRYPAAAVPMPSHPRDDGAPRPKWNSKWDFDRADKRVRIVVVAYGPDGEEETIDAREFIERLGEDHQGTTFAIHVETEQIAAGIKNEMLPEDEIERRGEPVLVVVDADGCERLGTIEWGGVTKRASIYLEVGGRLVDVAPERIRPDPGGERPVWSSWERKGINR